MSIGSIAENIHQKQYIGLGQVVRRAELENKWIFDSVTKEWFSPIELSTKYETVPNEEGWYLRFKVLDAVEGLKAADVQLQKILSKKLELENRVIKFYKSKSK